MWRLGGTLIGMLAIGCDAYAPEVQRRAGPACATDDDCTLLPASITCCNECPPAPPFEPVRREALDALLIQLETDCAERDRLCVPARCEAVPPGCEARAACVGARCVTISTGCGFPTS